MAQDKSNEYLSDFFIDNIIWPAELLTQELFRIVTVAHALDVENFADGKARLLEYKVKPTSSIVGKMVKDCGFTKDTIMDVENGVGKGYGEDGAGSNYVEDGDSYGEDGAGRSYGEADDSYGEDGARRSYVEADDVDIYGKDGVERSHGEAAMMDINDSSLCLSYSSSKLNMLFTGDMGKDALEYMLLNERQYLLPHYDILKVPHHGSKNSINFEFYDLIDFESAVISCGENNRYGHPAPETLERMRENGILCYITAESGQLTVRHEKSLVVNLKVKES